MQLNALKPVTTNYFRPTAMPPVYIAKLPSAINNKAGGIQTMTATAAKPVTATAKAATTATAAKAGGGVLLVGGLAAWFLLCKRRRT